MRERPIGIFDSGLGGLTVAGEIMRAMPEESIVYLGDTARCPYGPRPQHDVREFVLQIGRWLAGREVKLIVIACNTATAAGLALAQRVFDVPVVGVVEPGARAAVKATVNRRVGVIGTVGTIDSGAYSMAVRALDAGVTVVSAATPRFVDVVENGLRLGEGSIEDWLADMGGVYIRPSIYEMARDYLDPLKRSDIDTLVLGCTHFPLLEAPIQQAVGTRVRLISSAEETAREVADTLEARGHRADAGMPRTELFTTTGDAAEFASLGGRILGRRMERVEHVGLPELESQFDRDLARALEAYEAEAACD
ncbi:MAG: glutamate racemase [Coriobacteriia bacterium]|nr:glutamate racemase [Coriobacteriia bacterium]MBN2840362.1 glutamate racemase [Coriobacteriia bacterium]